MFPISHESGAEQAPHFVQEAIELHRLGIEVIAAGCERLLALAGKRMGSR
jgi:hypothetical protein